jgi:diadenylate cyclase
VVRDYMVESDPAAHRRILDRLSRIGNDRLLRLEDLEVLLGYERDTNPIDTIVEPRGFRVLSRIPGLSQVLIERAAQEFGGLSNILAADAKKLAKVSGLGPVRSKEVHEGLQRMREYFAHGRGAQGQG